MTAFCGTRNWAGQSRRPRRGRTGLMHWRHQLSFSWRTDSYLIAVVQPSFPKAVVRRAPNEPDPNRSFAARAFDVSHADEAAVRSLHRRLVRIGPPGGQGIRTVIGKRRMKPALRTKTTKYDAAPIVSTIRSADDAPVKEQFRKETFKVAARIRSSSAIQPEKSRLVRGSKADLICTGSTALTESQG